MLQAQKDVQSRSSSREPASAAGGQTWILKGKAHQESNCRHKEPVVQHSELSLNTNSPNTLIVSTHLLDAHAGSDANTDTYSIEDCERQSDDAEEEEEDYDEESFDDEEEDD